MRLSARTVQGNRHVPKLAVRIAPLFTPNREISRAWDAFENTWRPSWTRGLERRADLLPAPRITYGEGFCVDES